MRSCEELPAPGPLDVHAVGSFTPAGGGPTRTVEGGYLFDAGNGPEIGYPIDDFMSDLCRWGGGHDETYGFCELIEDLPDDKFRWLARNVEAQLASTGAAEIVCPMGTFTLTVVST